MFSLELNDVVSNKDSHFYFGGYNQELIAEAQTLRNSNNLEDASNRSKSNDGIFWMNINSKSHWEVYLYDANLAKIGGPNQLGADSE